MTAMNVDTLRARLSRTPPFHRRGDDDLNPGTAPAQTRPAAVLVPVLAHDDAPTVLFTRRAEHLSHHPGQISFPGGNVEPDDATDEAAALREAEEEIGLAQAQVSLIGHLDRYRTRTGFDILPVVGVVVPGFVPRLDAEEVAAAFEVPLGFFLDPANQQRHTRRIDGVDRHYYAFSYGEHFIWGATAGMLINLYDRLMEGGERP